jgi:class 3 adenylate cyclase/tetratricopeptide (TPR) repeat protein
MVEIRKAPEIVADSALSLLIDRYDQMIEELCPRNATAAWNLATDVSIGQVQLNLTDAYSRGSRRLSAAELDDCDGMFARISRLVGDLVYQHSENLRDPGTLSHLASFTAGRLCWRFTERDPNIALPSSEECPCAVLFADISGFTRLTERLARKGAAGAEELTAALNSYFGRLIEIVCDFGGDVLKFAGDALLAIFEDQAPEASLKDASIRAVAASLKIQREMQDFPEVEGTKLSLKIALAAGDLRLLHLGGVFGRCELLMVGDSLRELGDANGLAGPGDVIAAPSLWHRIESMTTGTALDGDNFRIESLTSENLNDLGRSEDTGQSALVNAPFRVSVVSAMRGYIPAAIYARLAAGQTDWLGELRKVTVVFVNLPGFNRETSLSSAQQLMVVLQRTIYQFEGSLNKLSVDDKGVSMLAGFGLPPVAHEDDAARAIGAALELHERIAKLGWTCSIGVATGRIFCGAYGNHQRREYTVIGDAVNTSARLMQAANGHILCDQTTWHEAEQRFDFDTLEPMKMKGKSEPVPCYRPIGRRTREVHETGQRATIGRKKERELFGSRLSGLVERQESSVVFFEGEAGIGKSHLIATFTALARWARCRILIGRGDAIERSTPWFAWRAVIAGMIEVDHERLDPSALEQSLRERFELDDELIRFLPLLSSLVPVAWPDNEWTAQMTGPIRAANTNLLLTRLIQQVAREKPLVIVLEDSHWCDSASLTLLREVATKVHPLLILTASRPLTRPLPRDVEVVLKLPTTEHVQLDMLSAEDAVLLARHLLGVTLLPAQIETLIRERTNGHPLFVEELAYTLKESGTVQIADGFARLVGDLHEFEDRGVLGSLDGVIVNRIDRLSPAEQLTVKVASVIGYEFPYPILRDIFPVEQERLGLRNHLRALDVHKVASAVDDRQDGEYVFRHRTIREVAYNLVLNKQRVELHHAIATWIEATHAGELDAHYPLLAQHWLQAGETRRGIDCLARAGEIALENNANLEATYFYRKALRLEAELTPRIDPMQRARWERRFGEALYRNGEITLALQHLRAALKLFGHPDPESRVGALLQGGWEMARQYFHRCRTELFGEAKGRPNEALIESIRAYERLSEIQYMRNEMPSFVVATFRAINLAEQYGFTSELGRACSTVAVMVGSMRQQKAAERYANRAREIVEKIGDLPSIAFVRAINCLPFAGSAEWEKAIETLEFAIKLSSEIGDRRRWSEATVLLVNTVTWSGDWKKLSKLAEILRHAAEAENVSQVACWAIGWMLWFQTSVDPESTATRESERALEAWMRDDKEQPLADAVFSLSGLLFPKLRRGEWEQALVVANDIEKILGNAQPVAIYLLPAYCAMADLYYALCQSGYSSETITRRQLRSRMLRMHIRIHVFSILIPMSTPLKYLSAGRRHLLKGHLWRARRTFRNGIRQGEKYRTPYFIAMLEMELARAVTSDSERTALQSSARDRFRQLGIEHPEVFWKSPELNSETHNRKPL